MKRIEKKKLEKFNEDKANSIYGFEAKEFLRKKLIGQNVLCVYDYAYDKQAKFYTVYYRDINIAVELLENGYGKLMNHYDDEPRSKDYQKLIFAQNKAIKNNKGIHKPLSDKPQLHIKDLTNSTDIQRAQLYLSYFKRSGRVPAVVEQVIGASRFKVWVPAENLLIILSLQGVFCDIPQRVEAEGDNWKSVHELYPIDNPKNLGFHFVRDRLHQKDVEIAINDVDKRSKFRGRIYYQGEDIAVELLQEGLAMVNHDIASQMDEYKTYKEAENRAKHNKDGPKNMWEGFDPLKEKEEELQRQKEILERKREKERTCKCTITEIVDGSNFYFQILGPDTENLENMMTAIHNSNLDSLEPYTPERNEIVLAKYSGDGKYYRARAGAVKNDVYSVFFIDYGNSDELKRENIRKLDPRFSTKELQPQAQTGRLAFVKCPKFDEEFGVKAADLFHDLVYEQECVGKYWIDRFGYCLKLGVPSKKIFVNITMVTEGFARVTKTSNIEDPVYKAIQEEERNAQKNQLGIWIYGTVPDSDEEKEEELEKKKGQKKTDKKKEKEKKHGERGQEKKEEKKEEKKQEKKTKPEDNE